MKESESYYALILAAGMSERMGVPKMMLPFDENRTFLDVITESYLDFGCSEVIVVVNETNSSLVEEYKRKGRIKIVINKHPDWQRFYSIQLGLKSMDNPGAVFIHNVDNPFVNSEVLNELTKALNEPGIVVPVYKDRGGHPVLISKMVVGEILKCSDYSVNFKTFLKRFKRVNVLSGNKNILVNINTLEEYHKTIKI
jgi:molybdenum cofactor cytidylyltransferase